MARADAPHKEIMSHLISNLESRPFLLTVNSVKRSKTRASYNNNANRIKKTLYWMSYKGRQPKNQLLVSDVNIRTLNIKQRDIKKRERSSTFIHKII